MKFRTVFIRALRLLCPACGQGRIAKNWLSTTERCSACQTDFVVEPGYFLGAIYFNYGVTVLLSLSAAIVLIYAAGLPTFPVVAGSALFCVVFPIVFFHYARALWLALDYYYDRRRRVHPVPQSASDYTSPEPDGPLGRGGLRCICPLCHQVFSAETHRRGSWSRCPRCHGDVLLVPATQARYATRTTS